MNKDESDLYVFFVVNGITFVLSRSFSYSVSGTFTDSHLAVNVVVRFHVSPHMIVARVTLLQLQDFKSIN